MDAGARRALECDLHDAPLDSRRLVVAFDIVAADHVENDVRAGARGRAFRQRNEILGLVIDGEIGAEAATSVAFLGTSGSRNDTCAEGLGKLDRSSANP